MGGESSHTRIPVHEHQQVHPGVLSLDLAGAPPDEELARLADVDLVDPLPDQRVQGAAAPEHRERHRFVIGLQIVLSAQKHLDEHALGGVCAGEANDRERDSKWERALQVTGPGEILVVCVRRSEILGTLYLHGLLELRQLGFQEPVRGVVLLLVATVQEHPDRRLTVQYPLGDGASRGGVHQRRGGAVVEWSRPDGSSRGLKRRRAHGDHPRERGFGLSAPQPLHPLIDLSLKIDGDQAGVGAGPVFGRRLFDPVKDSLLVGLQRTAVEHDQLVRIGGPALKGVPEDRN